MFHIPNISLTRLQSEASGIPLVEEVTEGYKESELEDLTKIIRRNSKRVFPGWNNYRSYPVGLPGIKN